MRTRASDPRVEEVALRFVEALVARNYPFAESFLIPELRAGISQNELRAEYERMIYKKDWVPNFLEVVGSRDDVPGMDIEDLGSADVVIAGDGISEALRLTISETEAGVGVSSIDWGRP